MTPPSKWYLDRESEDVILCVFASGSTTSPAATSLMNYGSVSDIKAGVSKGKQVLKVMFLSYWCLVLMYSHSYMFRQTFCAFCFFKLDLELAINFIFLYTSLNTTFPYNY